MRKFGGEKVIASKFGGNLRDIGGNLAGII